MRKYKEFVKAQRQGMLALAAAHNMRLSEEISEIWFRRGSEGLYTGRMLNGRESKFLAGYKEETIIRLSERTPITNEDYKELRFIRDRTDKNLIRMLVR
jgi:hypothetical protein